MNLFIMTLEHEGTFKYNIALGEIQMKLYRWYDQLKDPTRFLVFFIPAATLICGLYVPNITIKCVSGGLLLIMFVSRMIYRVRHNRS